MTKTIGIHSFRRGTGKTFFAGNLGLLLAQQGWRVGLVDTDFQAPALHSLFGIRSDDLLFTLNDFLNEKCELEKIVLDAKNHVPKMKGRLYLLPASTNHEDITKILRQGYPVEKLAEALRRVSESYGLNAILMDTTAGLTEENLRSLALADSVAIVMLPDQQHYQGTAVITDLAQQLNVPNVSLVVNQVPDIYEPAQVKREIEDKYKTRVAAVLPFVEECGECNQFFVVDYPTHALTINLMQIVLELLK